MLDTKLVFDGKHFMSESWSRKDKKKKNLSKMKIDLML
jgi:hypothetical protein